VRRGGPKTKKGEGKNSGKRRSHPTKLIGLATKGGDRARKNLKLIPEENTRTDLIQQNSSLGGNTIRTEREFFRFWGG